MCKFKEEEGQEGEGEEEEEEEENNSTVQYLNRGTWIKNQNITHKLSY